MAALVVSKSVDGNWSVEGENESNGVAVKTVVVLSLPVSNSESPKGSADYNRKENHCE